MNTETKDLPLICPNCGMLSTASVELPLCGCGRYLAVEDQEAVRIAVETVDKAHRYLGQVADELHTTRLMVHALAKKPSKDTADSEWLCCFLECSSIAEWEIYYAGPPDANSTRACTRHLGDLMTDAPEHTVFPIAPPDTEEGA